MTLESNKTETIAIKPVVLPEILSRVRMASYYSNIPKLKKE